MDLDPPPTPADPPAYPHTTATPRPLRSNPKTRWRWDSNGLLIGGAALLLVAILGISLVVENWSLARRHPYSRLKAVVFVAGILGWGLLCVVKGLWLRWRAR